MVASWTNLQKTKTVSFLRSRSRLLVLVTSTVITRHSTRTTFRRRAPISLVVEEPVELRAGTMAIRTCDLVCATFVE